MAPGGVKGGAVGKDALLNLGEEFHDALVDQGFLVGAQGQPPRERRPRPPGGGQSENRKPKET